MAGLPPLSEILEEYQLVDVEDRYRLLIDLGRQLEPMPDALKTDATKVRGCSASVWVYPTSSEGRLHFLADSNAAITKGPVGAFRVLSKKVHRVIDVGLIALTFVAAFQPWPGRAGRHPPG